MSVLSYARFLIGITAIGLPILSVANTASSIVPKADPVTLEVTDTHVVSTKVQTQQPQTDSRPICIALLMPSDNSPFLAAAKIVENGLLAANHTEKDKAKILLIESQEQLSVGDQISAAIFAGADVIVGPLQKDRVEELTKQDHLFIPTVALNISETKPTQQENLIMLSISTESEARQLAKTAVKNLCPTESAPHPKVIILKSDAPWTNKLVQAYEEILNENRIEYDVETATLDNLTDLKTKLEPELSTESKQYFNKLFQELSKEKDPKKLKFKQRQIYNKMRTAIAETEPPYQSALLAMDATMASLVRNRLHVRMNVWGTSTTNPGDIQANPTAKALAYDLNGLHFVDCPLVLNYNDESFKEKFALDIPYTLPARRLFALGVDAYAIAKVWATKNRRFSINGETGTLTVDRHTSPEVNRTPITAIINQGEVMLPAMNLPSVSLPESVASSTQKATEITDPQKNATLTLLPTYR